MTAIKDLLPIGSVVLNKNANKKLMVIGILMDIDGVRHDYIGVTYPEGFMDAQHLYAFNHSDIASVEFLGYVNAEFQMFRETISNVLEKKVRSVM